MSTIRQRKAIQKLSENLRNVDNKPISMGKILRESGYSEAVSKKPKLVTESLGWKDLIESYLPDEKLLQSLVEMLNMPSITTVRNDKGKVIREVTETNGSIKARGLDMILKVKGKYVAEKVITEDPYADMSDSEIEAKINRLHQERNSFN